MESVSAIQAFMAINVNMKSNALTRVVIMVYANMENASVIMVLKGMIALFK